MESLPMVAWVLAIPALPAAAWLLLVLGGRRAAPAAPSLATSADIAAVKPSIANLLAEYGAR